MVVDTGVLFAAADRNDPKHASCRDLLQGTREQLVVPVPVLVEFEYLVARRLPPGAWLALAGDLASDAYTLHPLDADGLLASARLQQRYADLPLGLVDAAVFTTCVALGERKVATLDHRHFSVLRTPSGDALEIVP